MFLFCTLIILISASIINTYQILIASHTTQKPISEQLRNGLLDQNFSCDLLNESTPQSLSARASAIQSCDIFLVVICRLYQRNQFCMEAVSYAKDIHKPIIAVLAESSFRPYGALGAISASAIQSIVLSDDNSLMHAVSDITQYVRTMIPREVHAVNATDLSDVTFMYDNYCK